MIRPAEVSDIPRLLEMGAKFAEKAKLVDHVGYDPASMEATFKAMLEGGHPLFVGERGAIGGTCTRHPFNDDHVIVQELFWWSEGREGLSLLAAFEEYARERAHSIRMLTLEAVNPDRMARLYEKRGYAPVERGFVKVI